MDRTDQGCILQWMEQVRDVHSSGWNRSGMYTPVDGTDQGCILQWMEQVRDVYSSGWNIVFKKRRERAEL